MADLGLNSNKNERQNFDEISTHIKVFLVSKLMLFWGITDLGGALGY